MNTPTTVDRERAKEIMSLALGVGISALQSEQLVAEKLAEWRAEPPTVPSVAYVPAHVEPKIAESKSRWHLGRYVPPGHHRFG